MNIVDLTPVQTVPRDGRDRPLVIPKAGGKPVALTRTTTFIDCIEDKSNLNDWSKREVLLGAGLKPGLAAKAVELDKSADDYKKQLSALAEAAMSAAGAHDKREKGTDLHALTEIVDDSKPLPADLSESDLADMAAYAFATIDFKMLMAEQFAVCSKLSVGGTPDRVLHYAGPGPSGEPIEGNFIGDLKTGNVEYGGLKIASQLAIYSRAELYDYSRFPVDVHDKSAFAAWKKKVVPAEEAEQAYSPLPDVNQEWGIIISLPSGTGEAKLLWADLTLGWQAAELAKVIRAMRSKSKKALLPWAGSVSSVADPAA